MSKQPDPTPRPIDHLAEMGEEDHPALVLRDRTLNHGDLRTRVAQLAGWLTAQMPEPRARVASWAAKGEMTCLLPLAAARAGLVYVPINPLLKRAQAAHILSDSGAVMLLANDARLRSLKATDLQSGCTILAEEKLWQAVGRSPDSLPPSDARPDTLAAILYTSGSTGRPKGVMLSHANLWLGAVSVAHYLGLARDDVVLGVLPLSFDYGQNQLFSAWYAGASVVPLDYLFPRDVVKACAVHGVTTLAAVPPLWIQLTETEWQADAAQSLRRITNSGGALTPNLVADLRGKFPPSDIFAMYGLTEAFRSTYLDPALIDDHSTSMGTAIPFAEVLVVDDEGRIAESGEEGELVHCGPLVAQGYWNDRERTDQRFKPAPAGSTFGGTAVWSGDRVRREGDGLLYFVGRRDAMIKSAGNRISPQEIEDAAMATGLVAEACAFGILDERLGQTIHLVVRSIADNTAKQQQFEAELSQDLPNFMRPKAIHWRGSMPLNPNGKIDRTALLKDLSA